MPKNRKRRVRILAIVLIVIAVSGLFALFLMSRRPSDSVSFDRSNPGAGRTGFLYEETAVVDRLAEAARQLLHTEQGHRSWVRVADRIMGQPQELSTVLLTSDQLALARVHLEMQDRDALQADLALIRAMYLNDRGLPAGQITILQDGSSSRPASVSTGATLSWLRLLAESYSLTGSVEILSELRTASDVFLDMTGTDGLLPADTVLKILKEPDRPDPAATPTIRPSITPTPEVLEERNVIRLADIDLYAIKLLSPLDARWQTVFERQRDILAGSVQGSEVVLPAYAFDPKTGGYIGFSGTLPLVSMEEALTTLLHLGEADLQREDALSYIRGRFYEDSALYEQVHRATGSRSTDEECIAGYAALARIARISDDAVLYARATDRLAWHIATNTRSAAYGAIFRTDPDSRVRVTAADNLGALLAFR